MSPALLKYDIRSNRLLWLVILAIFAMYLVIIIGMFDPNEASAINDMLALLPESLLKLMGFTIAGTTLLTFISGFIYGFLVFLFPMVYSIVLNNRLVAAHVDRGSMAYLLSTPNSLGRLAVTQAVFSLGSIAALLAGVTIMGIAVSLVMFPGALDVGKFLLLNGYLILMYWVIGGIGFLAGCAFNETRYSLAFGAGIPLMFLVMKMLGNTGEKVAWAGKFSIFSLFDPNKLFAGDIFVAYACVALVLLTAVLYGSAVLLFKKRDLPL